MPKRQDLQSVLLIGSGPIVIGQACEFDYSGTQAVRALKEEGYRVILINSNPATIMTDPELADRTYIEPITPDYVEAVIAAERPDAVLTTMGGQTALNTVLALAERGVFEKYGCELIGAQIESIKMAEDRDLFRKAMDEIGLSSARSGVAHNLEQANALIEDLGFPCIIRPSRTLGGSGGGIIESADQVAEKVAHALAVSPNSEILLEESLLGWKELELEVMRDLKDNVVVICHIENFDPMGVHTGDSITVAPVQTLTDKEYQRLRDASLAVMRKIGVDTGGSNVQFAINPEDGRIIVIEMNPRVSRSSALASKATGFPIAKIATKLAVGYRLDEISNDITGETPACFEPSIDYVVVKTPRFNFEKFEGADSQLGTQMKSVGESMGIGRNFREALQKALCSLEMDSAGFDREEYFSAIPTDQMLQKIEVPRPERIWLVAESMRRGLALEDMAKATGIDPWFLHEMSELVQMEEQLRRGDLTLESDLADLKRNGFSDARLAALTGKTEAEVRTMRWKDDFRPSYRLVDTCAAEFQAHTPYLYSSYDQESEAPPSEKKKVIILGSGPNRIGQGIEFDYCCVHAIFGLQAEGYEAIMVNCNPETVSTDYDMSDRLYFEPLHLESVLEIVDREKPEGVIVQFGGQTPLKLASGLQEAGVPILGTGVEAIDRAEDRKMFTRLIEELGLTQPENVTVSTVEEALVGADKIGYPLMIRPSFVLGGRAMRILYNQEDLESYFKEGVEVSHARPVLLDRYLHNAIEVDVDAVCDGKDVLICGIMEHIERAGIHSGDSSCSIPPPTLSQETQAELRRQARQLALALDVRGLMNVQFAVTKDNLIYVIEANPRASRTVPFVSKVTGTPWAQVAAKVMVGKSLAQQGVKEPSQLPHYGIKAAVFPFEKFAGVDRILGPEMKSTGEVMGIDVSFGGAFGRSQQAAANALPSGGCAFVSLTDRDKVDILPMIPALLGLGFDIVATRGTASYLRENGFECREINKVIEGSPHVVDALRADEIHLVVNTPEGSGPLLDSKSIRVVANELGVPTYTTISAASAAVEAMRIMKDNDALAVSALQDYLKAV